MTDPAVRFVADAMLGKLARWLRILGVDVVYDPSLEDRQLIALARREKRVVLTRDHPLASSSDEPPRLLIESDDYRDQLRQVATAYGIDPKRSVFTRCVDCNEPLQAVPSEQVRDRVPPYVFSTQRHFKRCNRCNRILWSGTHRAHMEKELELIFHP